MERLIRGGSILGDFHCRSEKKSKEVVAPGKCARSRDSVVQGVSGGRQAQCLEGSSLRVSTCLVLSRRHFGQVNFSLAVL